MTSPVVGLPDPSLFHLLVPKVLTGRARLASGERGRGARAASLLIIGFFFWAFIFGVLYRLLSYFRNVPEIGPLLAGKLLGMILVAFSALLLLSNVITALSSFFLAKDLDVLVGSPADWLKVYGAKLLETLINSSWMVVLMSIPMFTAYGIVFEGGFGFAIYAIAIFIPFLIIPSVVGSAITLTLVNAFPARRTRDILSLVAVMTAGGLVLMLRIVRPERLARPEGFRNLMDFVSVLQAPSSPFLPSAWLEKAVMGWLRTGSADWLGVALLWTTAAAFLVFGAMLHRVWFYRGYSKAQEGGRRQVHAGATRGIMFGLLAPIGAVRRELVLKEIRLFFRDTTQWSQLILLAVLVVVYVFNIRYLPLRGEGMTFFLINVVPFLNLALAGFVLASIAARFLFPGVSLEGRTLWLLRSSPVSMRDLLWAKFWVGTIPLLLLAVTIVLVTNILLEVSAFMFVVSLCTIAAMTFALCGLAVSFGTFFPQFETENAAQIPTSFGGLLYMMTSIALIGLVVVIEGRPLFTYVLARSGNQDPSIVPVFVSLAVSGALCAAATIVPLRMAQRRLELVER